MKVIESSLHAETPSPFDNHKDLGSLLGLKASVCTCVYIYVCVCVCACVRLCVLRVYVYLTIVMETSQSSHPIRYIGRSRVQIRAIKNKPETHEGSCDGYGFCRTRDVWSWRIRYSCHCTNTVAARDERKMVSKRKEAAQDRLGGRDIGQHRRSNPYSLSKLRSPSLLRVCTYQASKYPPPTPSILLTFYAIFYSQACQQVSRLTQPTWLK